jgi:hypothetical protein
VADRIAVLRYQWKSLAPTLFRPLHRDPSWPNWAIQRVLDRGGAASQNFPSTRFRLEDLSVSGFWKACTFGFVDLNFRVFPDASMPVATLNAESDRRSWIGYPQSPNAG